MLLRSGEQIVSGGGQIDYSQLDSIDWSEDEVERFQKAMDESTQLFFCGEETVS